jgi:hypothetical protein
LLPIDAGWRGSISLGPEVIVTNARGRDRLRAAVQGSHGGRKVNTSRTAFAMAKSIFDFAV